MKKNISINISGIIFHIEEDAYQNLKPYLETINKYFSTYEDSFEIISDIENRIAEIFLTKLNEEKQIITSEDVEYLMTTMGTISDFEAIEEPDSFSEPDTSHADAHDTKEEHHATDHMPPNTDENDRGKEKVFRDEKRKVLGGVAAGFAYFFSIDPLWIRLLLVVLLLNVFNFGISGTVFIAYLILWGVIPSSSDLRDEENIKKMFRSSENQVLGGVAAGLAAYFGADLTIIRLLLVISIPFGSFVLYLILWMITPLATTITEKMQMQGEPVTLSNIQQSVTKKISSVEGEESPVAKILLFPFRVISEVFQVLVKLIGPVGKVLLDVIRLFFGVILSFIGVVCILSLVFTALVLLGLLQSVPEYMLSIPVPIDVITSSFSPVLYVAFFLCLVIPMLFVAMIGISLIVNRFVVSKSTGWSLFGVWVIGIWIVSFTVPQVVLEFSNEGSYKERKAYEIDSTASLVLKSNFKGQQNLHATDFEIKSSQDSVVRLTIEKESFGMSKEKAIENAQMITYEIVQDGNTIVFDSNFEFKEEAKFRGQSLIVTLYIPLGQVFVFEEGMEDLLKKRENRKFWYFGDFGEEYQWVYDGDGLNCLTCKSDSTKTSDPDKQGRNNRNMEEVIVSLKDFDELEVHGFYDIEIKQGDDFDVVINTSSDISEHIIIEKYDDVLMLDFEKRNWNKLQDIRDDNEVNISITMPHLTKVKGSGLCIFDIEGFSEESVEINLSGASFCEIELDAREFEVVLSGASTIEASGYTNYLEVDMSGASNLKAYDLDAKLVDLNVSGASNAKITAHEELDATVSGLSNIRYRGNPDNKNINEGGMGKVRRSNN